MKNECSIQNEDLSFTSQKQLIREEVRFKRHLISEQHGEEYAKVIIKSFLKNIPIMPQSVISSYWPIRSEVNVKPLTEKLMLNGHHLALPAIADDRCNVTFRHYRMNDPVTMGPFRIPQPYDTAEEINPSIIIVPMLGFSRDGHRLGYGKGFYDQLLCRIRDERPVIAVGLAFSEQEIIDFPYEEHDQTMDWIITELECFKIKKG